MAEKKGALVAKKEAPFTNEQIQLIKTTVAKGATDDELKLFAIVAAKSGLDPFAKQIHFVKRKNNKTNVDEGTFQVSIDGFRSIADRTGNYAGNDDPIFDDENMPNKATVTVYKIVQGLRVGFTATARWDQYYPGDARGFMWKKMPHLMLGKCAEALALRKAFPQQLSGLYTSDEMQQAGDSVVDVPPATAPAQPARSIPGPAAPTGPVAPKRVQATVVTDPPAPGQIENRPSPKQLYDDYLGIIEKSTNVNSMINLAVEIDHDKEYLGQEFINQLRAAYGAKYKSLQ